MLLVVEIRMSLNHLGSRPVCSEPFADHVVAVHHSVVLTVLHYYQWTLLPKLLFVCLEIRGVHELRLDREHSACGEAKVLGSRCR